MHCVLLSRGNLITLVQSLGTIKSLFSCSEDAVCLLWAVWSCALATDKSLCLVFNKEEKGVKCVLYSEPRIWKVTNRVPERDECGRVK